MCNKRNCPQKTPVISYLINQTIAQRSILTAMYNEQKNSTKSFISYCKCWRRAMLALTLHPTLDLNIQDKKHQNIKTQIKLQQTDLKNCEVWFHILTKYTVRETNSRYTFQQHKTITYSSAQCIFMHIIFSIRTTGYRSAACFICVVHRWMDRSFLTV